MSNAIERLVTNYKNSNSGWSRYDYTFVIAATLNIVSPTLGFYYTAICVNRPYPPSLARDKNYLDIGKQTASYRMHFIYPFLKPMPKTQNMTNLKVLG
jgi:hypothetical protein